MKRDKNFYCIFLMICFVVVYITSFILMSRTVAVGNLIATASIIAYPATYFLGTLFSERYGKDKYFNLVVFSIVALILCALLVSCSSWLPAYNGNDGLEKIFVVDYRILFSFIAAFFVGQLLNMSIYNFLDKRKAFNFLISSVISITIDSLLFVAFAYVGSVTFKELIQMFSGQYVLSVVMMVIYSLGFAYLIDSVVRTKKKKEDMENIVLEHTMELKSVDTTPKNVKKSSSVKSEKKVSTKVTTKKSVKTKDTPKKEVKKASTTKTKKATK